MARAKKICPEPGCPKTQQGRYCPEHNAAHDKARGTNAARGYGSSFQAQRREWVDEHKQRALTCWRCGEPIPMGERWHLGHDDDDRTIVRGPEHVICNLSAAGRSSHQYD